MRSVSRYSFQSKRKGGSKDDDAGDTSVAEIENDAESSEDQNNDNENMYDFQAEFRQNQVVIEEILVEKTTCLYNSRFEMMNYFRKEENVILMLDYLFNPFTIPLMEIWVKKYPEVIGIDSSKYITQEMKNSLGTIAEPFIVKYYNYF